MIRHAIASRRAFIASSAQASAAFAIVSAPAKAAQFEFKCASNDAADQPSSVRLLQMWSAIEQESGGRIHTQFFPNSQLGGDAAMFSQLRVGALNFFLISPGNLASVVPSANIVSVGFGYKGEDEGQRVTDGPVGALIRQEATTKGVRMLRTFWIFGMNQVGSIAKPIRTPEDLRGFKIRVVESKITIDLFKTLGANPTPLNFREVYTALQTKLIDGEAAPLTSIETSKFYEVQKYISLTNHTLSGQWLIANAETWNSLPPDLQDIVERNNTKFATMFSRDMRTNDAALKAQLARHGMIFNDVDQAPFIAPLRNYYQYWADAFGATEWGMLQTTLGRKFI